MFNKQKEISEESSNFQGFLVTPASIKLSNKDLIIDSFRSSIFIYDFLDLDQSEKEDFETKKQNIFLDDIEDEFYNETNLLVQVKDVNISAVDPEELDKYHRVVMELPEDKKEIHTDTEMEFREVVVSRQDIQKEELKKKEEEKDRKIDTNPKFYRMTLTPDTTLYYGAFYNQLLLNSVNHSLYYKTDEYIAMVYQPNSVVNLPPDLIDKDSEKLVKWVDFLNIVGMEKFIIQEAGLGKRNGNDKLGLK
eukprot:CAMPEP_0205809134 /NCGR_PEP_ID=MMETSP0205-20121125/13255_1 /ASSEMBLY_ACC=CAM_ASM_000278 /TAXON_ID=36767 /ORGANISM="Euplotes focardii, Strain TN1" /LENGTH=248 /DNA_ID=CAMNT_0053085843 /DNA_START=153 /DNA_END=899 /DNA_ORIENTATION=+